MSVSHPLHAMHHETTYACIHSVSKYLSISKMGGQLETPSGCGFKRRGNERLRSGEAHACIINLILSALPTLPTDTGPVLFISKCVLYYQRTRYNTTRHTTRRSAWHLHIALAHGVAVGSAVEVPEDWFADARVGGGPIGGGEMW